MSRKTVDPATAYYYRHLAGVTTDIDRLKRREKKVKRMHDAGKSFEEIGEALGIKPDTARRDLERKLGERRGGKDWSMKHGM